MADRGLIHYQPLTGPVWREPVASRMAWLPQGQPQPRALPPNRLGDYARPEFAALYKPEGLQWTPSDRYVVRSLPRANPDWTVLPVQFAAPSFDPQNLEWIPKGTAWQPAVERRSLGDFVQPPFAALYKPDGLQWLFEGQLSVRSIPYTLQSPWVVDPKPVVAVTFDPQFFPFQATDIVLARSLRAALQSDFTTPPLPPGPDVIPPPASVGLGGSSAVHPRRIVYVKGDKRKPRTFIDKIGEPFVELEKTAEPVPDAESAGALPAVNLAPVREALVARLPAPLPLAVSTPLIARPLPEDDEDDDLLLLS